MLKQKRAALKRSLHKPVVAALIRLRNRHLLLTDAVALSLAPAFALTLRLDGIEAILPYLASLIRYTAISLCLWIAVFYPLGLYNRDWRFATVDDLIHIVRAVFYATALNVIFFFTAFQFHLWEPSIPRSLPFLSSLVGLIAVGASRFSMRWAQQESFQNPHDDPERVLIIGAGGAGLRVAKELQMSPQLGLRPLGFIDDDGYKHGMQINSLPVLGGRDSIADAVQQHDITQAVIAMPTAPGKTVREYLSLCEDAGIETKIVPSLSGILDGTVHVNQIRNVEIEDLLRREPIQTDIAAVSQLIRGRRVLITGGGGSIGSELCRQVLQCAPGEMALMGHGENSVFETHNELLGLVKTTDAGIPVTQLRAFIADIRFARRVQEIIHQFKPDIIFHAAAHKHVPLMEANPTEALSNNVIGTRNVLNAALAADVERFVMISTDKAVNPTSVMGASKRAAELLVLRAARQSGKPYVAVRFGNVLGSRGSVVPTFKKQIAAGGPVTVSHPDMTRFFMTIPEAVQLVLQASALGRGGEIFMLDMGDPVNITDLARDLIELSGYEVGKDIDIVYTGIRPGEKLYEELFLSCEEYQTTHHPKIRIARNASAFVPDNLDEVLGSMQQAITEGSRADVIQCLSDLIPEFQPDELRLAKAVVSEAVISDVAR